MITEKPSWIRHEGLQIFSIDIQPDGLPFATGGGDQKVRIWNMKSVSKDTENDDSSQRLLATIRDHFGSVNCVRWAKHGRYLASGSDDQVILIHERKAGSGTSEFGSGEPPDVENWKVILTLRGHTADVVIISHTAGMGGCSAPFPASPAPPHGFPDVVRLPPPPHRIVRVDRHRGGEGAPAVAASAKELEQDMETLGMVSPVLHLCCQTSIRYATWTSTMHLNKNIW